MLVKQRNVFFGFFYWVFGFCGLSFLLVACKSTPSREALSDLDPFVPIIVRGYEPLIVRRMALASVATYHIDQSGGVINTPDYNEIGFRDKPTTLVRNEINAAVIGSTDREIVIAFRGTLLETHTFDQLIDSVYDWVNDADVKLVSDKSISPGRVHQGFRDAFKSLWDVVLNDVESRRKKANLPVVVTGHSKGGALARLAALSLKKAGIPVAGVYTFGAPRTGDRVFAEDYERRIKNDFRFENADDVVPHTPPTKVDTADLLSQHTNGPNIDVQDSYQHVGKLQFFDWNGKLQEASPELDAKRTVSLRQDAYSLNLEKLAEDHSLVNGYQPRLANLVKGYQSRSISLAKKSPEANSVLRGAQLSPLRR